MKLLVIIFSVALGAAAVRETVALMNAATAIVAHAGQPTGDASS
jgi:hypothetical protein